MKKLILASLFIFSAQMIFAKSTVQNIPLQVTENGFEPSEINVKPGSHVVLNITRKTDQTCANQVVIKEKKIKKELPLNQEVSVDVGTVKKGKIKFACGMDMFSGHIIVN